MQRILSILALICTLAVTTARAQYVRVNIDTRTIAAMASAYGTESATESYYRSQVREILDRYTTAEVASAGIFTSKYLDRRALTTLGILSDGSENHYYRRIYNLVSAKIMPKIWTVGRMLLKNPQNALYWGSYLMKVCAETQSLCMQFEQIVTNSSLSFKDIAFLELNPEIARLVSLSGLGDVDWKTFFDGFGDNISGRFSKESLQQDLDRLYSMGAGLAGAGAENLAGSLLGGSSFNDIIQGKLPAIAHAAVSTCNFVEGIDGSIGQTLLHMTGGEEGVTNLFNLSNYNLTEWQSLYNANETGIHYTQRWYICRVDRGSEVLCDYTPPTDDNSVLEGSHWFRFNTGDPNFYPDNAQCGAILQNSENHAGWSRSRVNQLQQSAPQGHNYYFNYWMNAYVISRGGSQVKKAYACSIQVTHSWNLKEEVYEEVFDSYTMDLNTFRSVLNTRLSGYNGNEEGYTYEVGCDARNYYPTSDIGKLKGCEETLISVTCTDSIALGQGSTQYKCSDCGSRLSDHTRQCAMATSLTDDGTDTSELEVKEQEAEQQITLLQSEINRLEEENTNLIRQISTVGVEEAAELRLRYNANLTKMDQLESELLSWEKTLADIRQAKSEAGRDNDVQTDGYYRIPAIMLDCQTAYNLTWQGEGTWNGWTFERDAIMPDIKGLVHFRATLTLQRAPKYLMGIQIHRAIIGITWELTARHSDTEVVRVVELDPGAEDGEKQRMVDQAISEVAQAYPSCKVSTEYIKSEPVTADGSDDTFHLLWASDRLDIARQVETRLSHIYADLVVLEKMMHYKLNILDAWRKYGTYIDTQQGRRCNILQEAHHRWMMNARMRKETTPMSNPDTLEDR